MIILAKKYATAATLDFPMLIKDSGNLAASADWTPATGDCKISQAGGNVANTTNLPTAIGGTGSVGWKLTLTAAELTTSRLFIQIVDQTIPKAVEDQTILIETYGHASASYRYDYSAAGYVVPLASTVSTGEVLDTDIVLYRGAELPSFTWAIVDSNDEPVDLSGATLQVNVYHALTGESISTIEDADIAVGGSDDNQVTAAFDPDDLDTAGEYRYELRRTDTGNNQTLARGDLIVKAPHEA